MVLPNRILQSVSNIDTSHRLPKWQSGSSETQHQLPFWQSEAQNRPSDCQNGRLNTSIDCHFGSRLPFWQVQYKHRLPKWQEACVSSSCLKMDIFGICGKHHKWPVSHLWCFEACRKCGYSYRTQLWPPWPGQPDTSGFHRENWYSHTRPRPRPRPREQNFTLENFEKFWKVLQN